MKTKNLLIKPLLASSITLIGLVLSVFIKTNTSFNEDIFFNHVIYSLILFVFVFTLGLFKLYKIQNTFTITTIISSIFLVIFMPKNAVGFDDLAAILSYMIIMVAGLLLGVIIEIISKYRNNKASKGKII